MRTLKKRKWTVFFLMKSVDESLDCTIVILKQLMAIRFPDEIAIILGINFNRKNLEALRHQQIELIQRDGSPEFTTMFFKITTLEGGRRNTLEVLGEKNDFKLSSPEDLTGFLKGKILRFFKAKHYLLFTWDHGNGFEIFDTSNQHIKRPAPVEIIQSKRKHVLTMSELGNAISLAMGSKKIELIIMMNCNMQVFDTGYALRRNAKFLVAPQTLIGILDYYYTDIFSYLAEEPRTSPRELAEYVIHSFRNNLEDFGYAEDALLSVCRLKHYQQVAGVMNKLAETLMPHVTPLSIPVFEKVFRAAKEVDLAIDLIDLFSLFRVLRKEFKDAVNENRELIPGVTNSEVMGIVDELLRLENQIVYRKFTGPGLRASAGKLYGISVSTPFQRLGVGATRLHEAADPHIPEIFKKDSIFAESSWGKFIARLKAIYLSQRALANGH